MNWFRKLTNYDETIISVECEDTQQCIADASKRIEQIAHERGLTEKTRESTFFCGICGEVPISQYLQHSQKH